MLPKSMRSPHSWDGRGLMQLSWQHFAGGIGLVFAAMIAWFGALWLNLQGTNLWVFRLCMFLVLALAVGAIVWWLHNRQKAKPDGSDCQSEDQEHAETEDPQICPLQIQPESAEPRDHGCENQPDTASEMLPGKLHQSPTIPRMRRAHGLWKHRCSAKS